LLLKMQSSKSVPGIFEGSCLRKDRRSDSRNAMNRALSAFERPVAKDTRRVQSLLFQSCHHNPDRPECQNGEINPVKTVNNLEPWCSRRRSGIEGRALARLEPEYS
jgi:hypothetical protein